MIEKTLRRALPVLSVCLVALCVPRISSGQEFTRVTPKWAKEHPGRLEFSRGTAANGANVYTFRLLADNRSRFAVLTRISRQTENGLRPLFEVNTRSNALSTFAVLNAAVWPSEDLDVSFRVIQEAPVFDAGKITGFEPAHEYELRLEEFLNARGKLPVVDFTAVEREAKAAAGKKR